MKQEPQRTEEDIVEASVKRAEKFWVLDQLPYEEKVRKKKEFYIKEIRTVIKDTLAIAAQREQAVREEEKKRIRKVVDRIDYMKNMTVGSALRILIAELERTDPIDTEFLSKALTPNDTDKV